MVTYTNAGLRSADYLLAVKNRETCRLIIIKIVKRFYDAYMRLKSNFEKKKKQKTKLSGWLRGQGEKNDKNKIDTSAQEFSNFKVKTQQYSYINRGP